MLLRLKSEIIMWFWAYLCGYIVILCIIFVWKCSLKLTCMTKVGFSVQMYITTWYCHSTINIYITCILLLLFTFIYWVKFWNECFFYKVPGQCHWSKETHQPRYLNRCCMVLCQHLVINTEFVNDVPKIWLLVLLLVSLY